MFYGLPSNHGWLKSGIEQHLHCLEAWREWSGQTDEFEVSLRFSLQASAGMNAIELAVDVDVEQSGRGIRRPSVSNTIDGVKVHEAQIKRFNERIDHPHRIVLVDVVLQSIREQKSLRSINAIDKSRHVGHPSTGAEILPTP